MRLKVHYTTYRYICCTITRDFQILIYVTLQPPVLRLIPQNVSKMTRTARWKVPIFILPSSLNFYSAPLYEECSKKIGLFHFPIGNNVKFQPSFKQVYQMTHVILTCPCKFQLSILLALRPSIFKFQAISRQVHWMASLSFGVHLEESHRMTPKCTQTLRYPIYAPLPASSPKFQPFSPYGQPFSSYWHRDKSTEWPQMTLKVTPYTFYKSPKFLSILLHSQLFSSYRPFWDKCTLFMLQLPPKSKISLRFAVRLAFFWVTGNFQTSGTVHQTTLK